MPMSDVPTVSLITPTYRRPAYLQAAYAAIKQQTVRDFEWLILDDSPEPATFFQSLDDPRVRYRHHTGSHLSIGTKRNLLTAEARAPAIAHIDDDDYYAATYLERMLGFLSQGADLAKLSGWYLYSKPLRTFGYWNLEDRQGLHFVWSASNPVRITEIPTDGDPAWDDLAIGYGFSYVYRKTTWERHPFEDRDFDEDRRFARAAIAAGAEVFLAKDTLGLALHILHSANTSLCLPQYNLPPFLLNRLFPVEADAFLKLP